MGEEARRADLHKNKITPGQRPGAEAVEDVMGSLGVARGPQDRKSEEKRQVRTMIHACVLKLRNKAGKNQTLQYNRQSQI